VKSSGRQGDISFMSIIEEFKRMKNNRILATGEILERPKVAATKKIFRTY
jgi:hypothetical protein